MYTDKIAPTKRISTHCVQNQQRRIGIMFVGYILFHFVANTYSYDVILSGRTKGQLISKGNFQIY